MEELATFSIPEVAKFCRICEQNIRKWYRSGLLKPSVFSGSEPRFRMKNILEAYDRIIENKAEKVKEKTGKAGNVKKTQVQLSSADILKNELKKAYIK